jgi:hypothetical protein
MDPQRRNERLPAWLYWLVVIVTGGGLFVAYGWLVQKWGALVVVSAEVAILVAVVVIGVFLSVRRSRR